jgi:hypothetical protein
MEIKTIMPPVMSTAINMNRGFAKKSNLPDMIDALPAGYSKTQGGNVGKNAPKDASLQSQSMQTLSTRAKPMGNISGGSSKARSTPSQMNQY